MLGVKTPTNQIPDHRMIKAVIFDIDGTLIDSVDLHAASWVEAFRQFGRHAEQDIVRERIGEGADRLIPEIIGGETSEAMRKEIEEFRAKLFKEKYLGRVKPFPGVPELFKRLRSEDRKVVLGSSCTAGQIEDYKAIAGIADLIDAQATSDDADCSKPAPDIFQAALQCVGVRAADALVVGDTVYDVLAARKAGMKTVGLLCGGTPAQKLRDAGCVAIYRDPRQLLRRYEDSPLASGKSRYCEATREPQKGACEADLLQRKGTKRSAHVRRGGETGHLKRVPTQTRNEAIVEAAGDRYFRCPKCKGWVDAQDARSWRAHSAPLPHPPEDAPQ
jgi:beta-phosphoglucomutase-like phosphatase (HAD superfamily)